MPVGNYDAVGAEIHKFVDKVENGQGNEQLWQECSDAIGRVETPADRARLMEGLERSGLLPRLVLDCAAALETDDEEGLSKAELEQAANDQTGEVKEQTKLAAQALLDKWDEINTEVDEDEEDDVLTDKELQAWKQENSGDEHPSDVFGYEENDDENDDILPESQRYYESVLERPEASAQEKLKAVEELASMGVSEVTLTDNDGMTRTFKIEVSDIDGERKYVHLRDKESGKIVLRAIGRDGEYTQEVDRRGKPVEFFGSRWSEQNRESRIHRSNDYSDYEEGR